MAHGTTSKKSNKDDSGFDSEEKVNNSPSFLIVENARLNDLLDNCDDVLRKTNKEKREYRSLLGDAKEKVVELESLLVNARAQIDSLKSAPVVTNEPECTNCSTFLGELTVLKEKYASKVEELDVLRVDLDEMKSRPSLHGACTSCPVLHEKLDVLLVYARSLEAQLKASIPTICSTFEINVVKNMELAHYVDHLQDENDELRKLMGWLSDNEPQLRIMIETYKRQNGKALRAKKVGEGSGESDVPELPKTHHKNAFVPKPNHLRNRLDTTPVPPLFPPQTNNFQEPIKFKSVLGNEFFGKKGEKPSEEKPSEEKPEPKENPKPKPKPKPFHCEHCGRDGHLAEFCLRRKREERLARELANKDRYRPSRGVPEPRLVPRGEGMVRTIYPRDRHEFVPRGGHHIEKVVGVLGLGVVSLLDVPLLTGNTSMGGTIVVLGPRGATGHGLPFVVRVVLQGDVWVFHLGEIGWILLTLHLSKWRGTNLIRFVLTPVLSHFLTLTLVSVLQVGGMEGFWLIDSGCSRHMTEDRRWFFSLTTVMTKEYITFGIMGKVEWFLWAR
jgi:hypothetical protein